MFCTKCLPRHCLAAPTANPAPILDSGAFPIRRAPAIDPVTEAGDAAKDTPAVRSSCPAGTKLIGLNYLKNGQDPVALEDKEYPEWLWSCLDVVKSSKDSADDAAGDEFSKSKKQRKLAAKRQKTLEAQALASGNLEALAPKIPLQQQSINILGEENSGVEHNIEAAKGETLKKALRKERKAKIKESNYLKSM